MYVYRDNNDDPHVDYRFGVSVKLLFSTSFIQIIAIIIKAKYIR